MGWKYLLWIIPIVIIIVSIVGAYNAGIEVGIMSVDAMEEFACQLCADGLNLCSHMMESLSRYNGTVKEAITDYLSKNNETIINLFTKYGASPETDIIG